MSGHHPWKALRARFVNTVNTPEAEAVVAAEKRKISAEAMAYHLAFSEPGDPCNIADCPEPTHKRNAKEN